MKNAETSQFPIAYNPAFDIKDFHGTTVLCANLPFLHMLHESMTEAVKESGEHPVNLPPFIVQLTPANLKSIVNLLAPQELPSCLGAAFCKMRDQLAR